MMLLDDRTGSGDLLPLIRTLGVRVEHTRLDFADMAFMGNGPEGSPVSVGVEVKAVGDVLQCIGDGRFAGHQLPGLVSTYDQVWLVVEGPYKADREGVLHVMRSRGYFAPAIANKSRAYMYREFDAWLMTLEIKAGVRVRRTWDRAETARVVADLYHWWVDKEWAEHRSHLALHTPAPDHMMIRKPSLLRKVASQLPGVGWDRSLKIDQYFDGSLPAMLAASTREWSKVPGIGRTLAQRITEALHGQEAVGRRSSAHA